MDDRLILMGVVGRPHGVRGAVRVTAYTEDPQRLADYLLSDGMGRRFRLCWISEGVARIAEMTAAGERLVQDRDAAQRLTNLRLYACRAALPDPGEDEFYLADLVGLAARDASGRSLGRVAQVHDYGAGASLEIEGPSGSLIVPFTRAVVPEVDLATGWLVVEQPAEVTVEAPR